jgi:phage shock protein C
MTRRLVKSSDKMIFGVAGGVADYFDLDPTLARVAFVVLCFICAPVGFVAYIAMALLMPSPVPATVATPNAPPPTETMPVE